ncbi:MAG: YkgJ family cysteine cluster protein [Leptonema sp. (in: Bacteria)]|nr:YkgJ family cysteine cluster protein [Leptonema sp. (in: bacteria)]
MFDRLKSLFGVENAKQSKENENNLYYVAGKTPSGSKIPNSVSIDMVENALSGEVFKWTCTACGQCCRGPGAVYFTENDLVNIRQYLNLDKPSKTNQEKWNRILKKLVQKKQNNFFVHQTDDACMFLGKDNKCTIYEVRPLQCRTFPFWTSNFEGKESYQALKALSPGVRNGRGQPFSNQDVVIKTNRTEDRFAKEQISKNGSEPKKFIYL